MPIYAAPLRSYSILTSCGDDLVLMQGRIAELLGIHDGDVVEFELVDVGETIRLPIKINDIIKSDVLIHDWNALGLTSRVRYGHKIPNRKCGPD